MNTLRILILTFLVILISPPRTGAQTNVDLTLTITNILNTTNDTGASLTLQSQTIVWTNRTPSQLTLYPRLVAATNTTAKATTNLYTKLRTTFGNTLLISYASSTSMVIRAPISSTLSASVSTNWASLAFATNQIATTNMAGSLAASNLIALSITLSGSNISSWASIATASGSGQTNILVGNVLDAGTMAYSNAVDVLPLVTNIAHGVASSASNSLRDFTLQTPITRPASMLHEWEVIKTLFGRGDSYDSSTGMVYLPSAVPLRTSGVGIYYGAWTAPYDSGISNFGSIKMAVAPNWASPVQKIGSVFTRGDPGAFDSGYVTGPRVRWFDHLQLYVMTYFGGTNAMFESPYSQGGLATSPDGTNWTRVSTNALITLTGGEATNDAFQIFTSDLVYHEGIYYWFYLSWGLPLPATGRVQLQTATSLTGPWTKHPNNPITGPDLMGDPSVTKIGDRLWLMNAGGGAWNTLVSTNLVNWTAISNIVIVNSGFPASYSSHFIFDDHGPAGVFPNFALNGDVYLTKPSSDLYVARSAMTNSGVMFKGAFASSNNVSRAYMATNLFGADLGTMVTSGFTYPHDTNTIIVRGAGTNVANQAFSWNSDVSRYNGVDSAAIRISHDGTSWQIVNAFGAVYYTNLNLVGGGWQLGAAGIGPTPITFPAPLSVTPTNFTVTGNITVTNLSATSLQPFIPPSILAPTNSAANGGLLVASGPTPGQLTNLITSTIRFEPLNTSLYIGSSSNITLNGASGGVISGAQFSIGPTSIALTNTTPSMWIGPTFSGPQVINYYGGSLRGSIDLMSGGGILMGGSDGFGSELQLYPSTRNLGVLKFPNPSSSTTFELLARTVKMSSNLFVTNIITAAAYVSGLTNSAFLGTDDNGQLVSKSGTNLWSGFVFTLDGKQFDIVSATNFGLSAVSYTQGTNYLSGELTIVPSGGDIIFTNDPSIKASDYVTSRYITNGGTATIAIKCKPDVFTNMTVTHFK